MRRQQIERCSFFQERSAEALDYRERIDAIGGAKIDQIYVRIASLTHLIIFYELTHCPFDTLRDGNMLRYTPAYR